MATTRRLVAACAISFACLSNATWTDRTTGTDHEGAQDDCENSFDRDISFRLIGDATRANIVSGAPISMEVAGSIGPASSTIDVDDCHLTISIATSPGVESPFKMLSTFELDLCTDVTNVECPIEPGSHFSGTATWNAVEVLREIDFFKVQTRVETTWPGSSRGCEYHRAFTHHVRNDQDTSGVMLESPAVTHKLLEAVNNRVPASSWTAEHSPRFHEHTIQDARRVAGGTVMRGQLGFEELPRRRYAGVPQAFNVEPTDTETAPLEMTRRLRAKKDTKHAPVHDDDIPAEFDAREAFPECAEVIGRIRDQSDCGSCWAFASTEAFNDRRCIVGIDKGSSKLGREASAEQLLVLSAEDTTACCHGFRCGLSMGCNGGQPGSAWKWFTRKGVVTGGDYSDIGQGTTCKPYEFQPCAHHVDPEESGYPECPDGEYPTPECRETCSESTFSSGYETDKKLAREAYSLGGMYDIQRDMMHYGSVTAAFSVYSDFLTYKGGVYEYVEGSYMGGHAVKIIGWGTDAESGKDYWLVANSWNPSWGEGGLFRIARGVNECGIEGQIVAGEVSPP